MGFHLDKYSRVGTSCVLKMASLSLLENWSGKPCSLTIGDICFKTTTLKVLAITGDKSNSTVTCVGWIFSFSLVNRDDGTFLETVSLSHLFEGDLPEL